MKVAMVTSWLSHRGGGVSAVVEAISHNIAVRKVDVRVFGLEEANANDTEVSWAGAPVETFRIVGPQALGYSPTMARAITEWKPDVAHVHGVWTHPSRSVLQWSRATNRPYIVSPHGMLDPWALQNSAWKKRIAGFLYEKQHLQYAACIHALNRDEYEAIRAFGLTNPVAIVPNGVDLPQLTGKPAQPQEKTMLYLGRLHPKKGVSNLLRAWADVCSLAPETTMRWRLAIAGWGASDYEAELQKLVMVLQLANKVCFVGPQFGTQKTSIFVGADAFILPSLSEGLPMAVLEAWAHRLPVLMTSHCNLPEGFAVGAALEIEVDVERLGKGILTFLHLPEAQRLAMGRRGRQLVEEDFVWSSVAMQMTDVYRWVVHGGEKPRCVCIE